MKIKIDALLRAVAGARAGPLIAQIDKEYERHSGHTPHGHDSRLARNAGKELEKKKK